MKKDLGMSPVIPKLDGLSIPISFHRKSAEGKMQKAVLTIGDVIREFSFIPQAQELIFMKGGKYFVEEYDQDVNLRTEDDEEEGTEKRTRASSGPRGPRPTGDEATSIPFNQALAKAIKQFRLDNNLTQTELGARIGVSGGTVTGMEYGKYRTYKKTIRTILQVIGAQPVDVGLEDYFGDEIV